MPPALPLFESHLTSLPLIARGKVRDIYEVGSDRLLLVACDRVSAFDVVMNEPIREKGKILTKMALFWFSHFSGLIKNHLTDISPENVVDTEDLPQILNRSMLVKRLAPIPVEAVVRGYLAGSAWAEYQRTSSVCGISLPSNLQNSEKLPEPIFTPATKAAPGEHDENISFEKMCERIGRNVSDEIRRVSIAIYKQAADIAIKKGIIIADTKLEFGFGDGEIVLMDEILTPDSSRFWSLEAYTVGSNPRSFDKQYIRDWLEEFRSDGVPWNKQHPAPNLPFEVREATTARYQEALRRLLT